MLMTTLSTRDGTTLALRDWPVSGSTRTVLIVHGLGEHAGRFERVATWLNARGLAVRAYDQYGHGSSSGRRGHLATDTQLVDHLTEVFAMLSGPVILMGHSLGGLVAASAVAHERVKPAGLVLSSPALAVPTQAWQRAALAILPRWAPNLTLGNGLEPTFLSHDPKIVQAYRDDPLVHDRICARLGGFVANEGTRVRERAASWPVRTLLLYAGDDRLVDPAGSEAWSALAPRPLVTSHRFESFYHEIFNEPGAEPVFKALGDWLDGAD